MKKLITILTVVAVFGLAGCGGGGSPRASNNGTGGGGTPTPTPPQTPAQAQEVAVDSPPTIPTGMPPAGTPTPMAGTPAAAALELASEIVRQDSLSDRISVLGNSVATDTGAGSTTFTVEGTFEEAAPVEGFTPTVSLTSRGLIANKGIFKDGVLADTDNPCAGLTTGTCTALEISEVLEAYDILPASIKGLIDRDDFNDQLAASDHLSDLIFNLIPPAFRDSTRTAAGAMDIATLLGSRTLSLYNLLTPATRSLVSEMEFGTLIGKLYTALDAGERAQLSGVGINADTFNILRALNPLITAAGDNLMGDIALEQLKMRSSRDFDASIVRWKYSGTADNYLTLGYWTYAAAGTDSEVGADVHGDDPFDVANVAGLTGTATYNGNAFGKAGSANFVADVSLMADFGDGTAGGTIGGTINRFNHDTTLRVTLSDAAITGNSFTGTSSATDGAANAAAGTGNWGGRFYGNGAAITDHPLAVGGTFGVNNAGDTILGVFGAGLVTPTP